MSRVILKSTRGTKNFNAKLDEEKVRAIRAATDTIAALARQYKVSESLIRRVRNRELWGHVQ